MGLGYAIRIRAANAKPIRKTLFFLIYHIFLINPKKLRPEVNIYTNQPSAEAEPTARLHFQLRRAAHRS